MTLHKKLLILTIGFAAGIALVLYPFFADVWNQYVNSRLVVEYAQTVAAAEDDAYEEEWALAQAYNEELRIIAGDSAFPDNMTDTDKYESVLDVAGDGMMGYITIPKISISIPIYHYTNDEVLQKGVGHMFHSSLPVGGESTHAILTAHRGLPTNRLFTDLDLLEAGDVIYLQILDRTLAYEVYETEVVEPTYTEGLSIQEGRDIITLVTCTPYGVNSDRLLVRAERIELTEEESAAAAEIAAAGGVQYNWVLVIIAAMELAAYLALVVFLKRRGRQERADARTRYLEDDWWDE